MESTLRKGGVGARRSGGFGVVGGRVPEQKREQARGAGSRYSMNTSRTGSA